MTTKAPAAMAIPAAATTGARRRPRHSGPADDRPDRNGHQEAEQDQGRRHLRVGIDGGSGEEGNIDQGGHEGGADRQVDRQGAPGRSGREGAAAR